MFDTDADEPGMVVEATLPAAERQQVGILDKRLLQTLAEAVGIEAGLLCLDNDVKVDRPRPGRSNRALVLGQMVDSVQDRRSLYDCEQRSKLAHAAPRRLYSTSGLSDPSDRSAAGPKQLRRTQPPAGVSSFLDDLSFALAAAPLPPSSGSRAHDLLGDVVAPEVGGAHVAAGDLDRLVAGLAHDVVELGLRLGRRGGEAGAQAVARVGALDT